MSGYNCEDEDICLFCSAMLLPLPQWLRKDTARNNDKIIIPLGNIYNTCKLSIIGSKLRFSIYCFQWVFYNIGLEVSMNY